MLMDDVGLGVKFGRTLGNVNALLVTAKEGRAWIIEAEEREGKEVSDELAVYGSGKVTVYDFMWHPGVSRLTLLLDQQSIAMCESAPPPTVVSSLNEA
ncbi:hypothetical protein CesoFtcFv8_020759 [Champsocephalus esox]|uniref:Uncharacterized protein n=2 Tax=Champsocephalus TaxID=52236 RepID=A0AAN8CQT9_CHAGU|nr:hypothetical protein CesoFtcFv8_020759 [Champsocephalus esox]KAK5908222.1 hypothetical protein CgunFtcFv8_016298 [Champsocephalus gunnari]